MKKIELEEIQKIELDILIELDKFCKKNNINYFLGCGTLCGAAVRKGFFPWDDDIDVLMPRSDYEIFINSFNANGLKVLTCENKDYYYPYAKLVDTRTIAYECKNNIKDYGVFIDVFPIDGVPNKLYLLLLKPLKYLMMSQWGCYLKNRSVLTKIIYKILSVVTNPFPKNFFAKILNSICKKYSLEICKKSGIVCHYRFNGEIVDSNIFKAKTVITFEENKFYAPKAYKKYLKNLYGDYENEDEHTNHSYFRAYWKE